MGMYVIRSKNETVDAQATFSGSGRYNGGKLVITNRRGCYVGYASAPMRKRDWRKLRDAISELCNALDMDCAPTDDILMGVGEFEVYQFDCRIAKGTADIAQDGRYLMGRITLKGPEWTGTSMSAEDWHNLQKAVNDMCNAIAGLPIDVEKQDAQIESSTMSELTASALLLVPDNSDTIVCRYCGRTWKNTMATCWDGVNGCGAKLGI